MVQYSLESVSDDGRSFVFTSTAIENIATGCRARETYRLVSNDEFIETFALAGPGKEFETYSETRKHDGFCLKRRVCPKTRNHVLSSSYSS